MFFISLQQLMICYVLIPDDLLQSDTMYSPVDCLRKIKICETLLSRIIPSQERDNQSGNWKNTKKTETKSPK